MYRTQIKNYNKSSNLINFYKYLQCNQTPNPILKACISLTTP